MANFNDTSNTSDMATFMGKRYANPFRPGAGHSPPYLAGREEEKAEFRKLLTQTVVLDNPIITGLRGVGKTVLLEELKRTAIQAGWYWVGTDLSESASLNEETLATRLLADLAVVTAEFVIPSQASPPAWFHQLSQVPDVRLGYDTLMAIYRGTPGLVSDKLKAVLELVAGFLTQQQRGLVFAYDEAQNVADHSERDQFPLSMLLDVFQSLQRKEHRFLLTLVGLPTLFPKLVEARTSAERMFHVINLDRLDDDDARDAVTKPIQKSECPVVLADEFITEIVKASGGYPYFIQFICREVFDTVLQKVERGGPQSVSIEDIIRKLDADFFMGRWSNVTDRQRDLLYVIAHLDNFGTDFSVQDVVNKAKELVKEKQLEGAFSASHCSQMLSTLSNAGFVYKAQHGKYRFAVPLLGQFIRRQPR
jgi:Cdc6-like AAA superfamily ATPase